MFRRNLLNAVVALTCTLFIFSCSESTSTSNLDFTLPDTKVSLDEFRFLVESEAEKEFFNRHEVIDNTYVLRTGEDDPIDPEAKPTVKFRWGGNGCSNPIGICFILREIETEDGDTQAGLRYTNDKLVILPTSSDNGLTTDGYVPVFDEVFIPDHLAQSLAMPFNSTIRPGIYKAEVNDIYPNGAIVVDVNTPEF